MKDLLSYKHPTYLRLGKNGERNISKKTLDLKIREVNYIARGSDVALISHGNIMEEVYFVYQKLLEEQQSNRVLLENKLKEVANEIGERVLDVFNPVAVAISLEKNPYSQN